MSEDCLYLNVWTPDLTGSGRPVLLWIHGGSYLLGAASQAWFDGAELARALDAVIVTTNYRIGAFGWLRTRGGAADRPQGNMMLRDQIAALQWIQRNIESFSGDRHRVTIAGQSAGGKSVVALLAVPEAAACFSQAITLSGRFHFDSVSRAEDVGARVLAALGLTEAAAGALWEVDSESLVAAGTAAIQHRNSEIRHPGAPFGPILDGTTLTLHPFDAISRGALMSKPVMIGTTADETRLRPLSPSEATLVSADLGDAVMRLIGLEREAAELVAARYRRRFTRASNEELFFRLESDSSYVYPNDLLALVAASEGGVAYRFVCDWRSPNTTLRACHGIDIALLFGTHKAPGMKPFIGWGPDLRAAVDQFQEAVRAFVHSGVPAVGGRPWSPCERSTLKATLLCSTQTTIGNDESHTLWSEILAEGPGSTRS